MSDMINHPSHYNAPGRKECIVEMEEKFGIEKVKAFCELNAYKYRYRAEMKNGAEDIKKAEWYESKLQEYAGQYNMVTQDEVDEWEVLQEEVRAASHLMSVTHNPETCARDDRAVENLIKFEKEHGLDHNLKSVIKTGVFGKE